MFKKALFVLLFVGPIIGLFQVDLSRSWEKQQESGVGIAPKAISCTAALVHIYQAKAYKWKGAVSVRTWIATKQKYARGYTVYEIEGWNADKGKSVVSIQKKAPDQTWFGQTPELVYELKGPLAEKAIDRIDQLARAYPFKNQYEAWFGPNDNTFVAHIVRNVDAIDFAMPPNALGKDYLASNLFFDRSPSGTGYQINYKGMVGVLVARTEGFELNIAGLVLGVNPSAKELKLPGFGIIKLSNIRLK